VTVAMASRLETAVEKDRREQKDRKSRLLITMAKASRSRSSLTESVVEKDQEEEEEELKDIHEFFSWEEDESEYQLCNEFEELPVEEGQNELTDYANDIIYQLKEMLSRVQTRKPSYRFKFSRMSSFVFA